MEKEKKCVIIGASPEYDKNCILHHSRSAGYVVCADGGFAVANQLGIKIDLVVGDFDSSPKDTSPLNFNIENVKLPQRKDYTDMMIAVKQTLKRKKFSEIILLGATGGRLDHTYANICTLKYLLDKNITAKMIDKYQEIFLAKPNSTHPFLNKKGQTISVFPFGCNDVKVRYHGFEYGSDCVLTCNSPIGISNVINKNSSYLYVEKGCALIITTLSKTYIST